MCMLDKTIIVMKQSTNKAVEDNHKRTYYNNHAGQIRKLVCKVIVFVGHLILQQLAVSYYTGASVVLFISTILYKSRTNEFITFIRPCNWAIKIIADLNLHIIILLPKVLVSEL